MRVTPNEAAHSRAELEIAVVPIADEMRATPGSPYYGAATETDGSGIVVFADDSVAGAEMPERWGVPADTAVSLKTAPRSNGDRGRFVGVAVEENLRHDLLLVSAPVDNYLYE